MKNFRMFASNANAKESLRSLVGTDFLERIDVTYTNVNPDEVDAARSSSSDRTAELSRHGVPANRFLVFGLGQFIDRKGRWTFLEAAERIATEDDGVCFVWITNSNLSDEDAERVRGFGLAGRFFLLRSEDVSPDHLGLMRFLRYADTYVLPSFVEGLPISLLEAMSLGVPSISTNVYAIPEAIQDGETGVLVEPGDADALASAIRKLRNDESLRKQIGAAGRRIVLENFSEDKVAEVAWNGYRRAWVNRK
jgi:glycosyltransferase involved in cell wall biosynthesis